MRIRDLWDKIKHANIHRRRREKRVKKKKKDEIMAKNFPNLKKQISRFRNHRVPTR